MVDYKEVERRCRDFLLNIFDKVNWLSEYRYSEYDFECIKDNISHKVEAKYSTNGSVYLTPNQKSVDAVVVSDGHKCELIWRKDFGNRIKIASSEIIKISSITKEELDKLKPHKRVPYDEVIQMLLKDMKGGNG